MNWLIFFYIFNLSFQTKGFEYADLVAKADFPPPLEPFIKDKGDPPIGHEKPFGFQRTPEGPVKEYSMMLEPITFWKNHVSPHIPLVYRGVIKDSPAISLWNDEYLAEHYGNLDVLVEHKREDRSSTSGRMVIKDFLKNYRSDDLYIVTMFPKEMMHQVRAINSVLCGTFKNYTHESNFWMSSGGTRSVVHYDADHNLHCVIDGRKDFMMIPNTLKTKTNLYFKQKDPGVGSGFSFLDPDKINMKKFPRIAKVPWTWASLYPGDCIFIPSKYIHQVRGYGRTLAVTTLFTADLENKFSSEGCPEDIMEKKYTMADIPFLWTYKKGDSTIDMGYMNTELVKNDLIEEISRGNENFAKNGRMNMKQFVYFSGVFSPYGRNKAKVIDIWKNAFYLTENDYLDVEKVKQLSLNQLRKYCRVIESPHGVVTNGSEPVFVRPGERHKWEIEHPDDSDEQYLDDEEELHRIASRDNMLEHLSPEEREKYIQEKMTEKEKYGVKYNVDEELLNSVELSEEKRILMEMSWRFDDIPDKFKEAMSKGKIPKRFRNYFVDALPESIVKKYGHYFEEYRLPEVMLRALMSRGGNKYKEKALKALEKNEIDDSETLRHENEKVKRHNENLNENERMHIEENIIKEENLKKIKDEF